MRHDEYVKSYRQQFLIQIVLSRMKFASKTGFRSWSRPLRDSQTRALMRINSTRNRLIRNVCPYVRWILLLIFVLLVGRRSAIVKP